MDNDEQISPSLEDYLERIYLTQIEKGVVRVRDISKTMSVRMPSVNNAISMLKKKNFVTQEPYGYVEITGEGKAAAIKIFDKHKLLADFFLSIGVPSEVAERDACCAEHVISEVTFSKIKKHFEKIKTKVQI